MGVRGDFLVIGSGIAGLRAAISLAETGDVVMLTKADPRESNTGYAQGGIAAAVGPDDSPDLHFADTIAAGDGLCVPEAVRVLVTDGPRYVNELIAWGVAFDRDGDVNAVLRTLYVLFFEGYVTGADELCEDAVRLARLLPESPASHAQTLMRLATQEVEPHPRPSSIMISM